MPLINVLPRHGFYLDHDVINLNPLALAGEACDRVPEGGKHVMVER